MRLLGHLIGAAVVCGTLGVWVYGLFYFAQGERTVSQISADVGTYLHTLGRETPGPLPK